MEQSRNVFLQMQEQLQNQTRNVFSGFPFPGFPGMPGFGAQPGSAQQPEGTGQAGGDGKPDEEKKS
jgi:hypothetical protein